MNKKVTLSASYIEPKDLCGDIDTAGLSLLNAPRIPEWWPNRGEDIHIVITDSHLLTKKTREAISVMKQRLYQRGSSCFIAYEKETNK